MAKAGTNCNAIDCEFIDGRQEIDCCVPKVEGELLAWFEKRDRGEPVGRAPDWPCPHYSREFF